MKWIERLKWAAGWDLFLEVVAIIVLFGAGVAVLMFRSCGGEDGAHAHVGRVELVAERHQADSGSIMPAS